MKTKDKRTILILFLLGLLLAIAAPYLSDFIFSLQKFFDFSWNELQIMAIIHSIQLGGLILSGWGMVLLWKKKNTAGGEGDIENQP